MLTLASYVIKHTREVPILLARKPSGDDHHLGHLCLESIEWCKMLNIIAVTTLLFLLIIMTTIYIAPLKTEFAIFLKTKWGNKQRVFMQQFVR